MDDRWRSVQEIAEYLGVSTDSVYRWVDQRGLPAHRVGRLLRFKCAEVDGWIHRHDDEASEPEASTRGGGSQKIQAQKRASSRR